MKKIIVAFLFAFCFQSLDVYGSENCCDKCCEDCGGEGSKAGACVNKVWYGKKQTGGLVLRLFKETKGDKCISEDGKIVIDVKGDKIEEVGDNAGQLKLDDGKYAFFTIKKKNEENFIYLYCSDIGSEEIEGVGYGIFEGCEHEVIFELNSDTTNVENMQAMFLGCNNLRGLSINTFNTEKVTNMSVMFARCDKLEKLDLKNFNTQKVKNMASMFGGCKNVGEIILPEGFGENATNKEHMFDNCDVLLKKPGMAGKSPDEIIKALISISKKE